MRIHTQKKLNKEFNNYSCLTLLTMLIELVFKMSLFTWLCNLQAQDWLATNLFKFYWTDPSNITLSLVNRHHFVLPPLVSHQKQHVSDICRNTGDIITLYYPDLGSTYILLMEFEDCTVIKLRTKFFPADFWPKPEACGP